MPSLKAKKFSATFFRGFLLLHHRSTLEYPSALEILLALLQQAMCDLLAAIFDQTLAHIIRGSRAGSRSKMTRHDSGVGIKSLSEPFSPTNDDPHVCISVDSDLTQPTHSNGEEETPSPPATAGAESEAESAVDKVFQTREILLSILTHLDPSPLRNAILVNKCFYTAIESRSACRAIRVALGLEFRKEATREQPTLEEITALSMPLQVEYANSSAYLNVNIGEENPPRYGSVPCLTIKPFVRDIMTFDVVGASVTMKFHLVAAEVYGVPDKTHEKGVVRKHIDGEGVMKYTNPDVQSWAGMKILKDAMSVRAKVTVDYRVPMLHSTHPHGVCTTPFCQVGRFGIQRVSYYLSSVTLLLLLHPADAFVDFEDVQTRRGDSAQFDEIPRRCGVGSQSSC